jgi:glycosyltransferase involved in cell wall biosynthesis
MSRIEFEISGWREARPFHLIIDGEARLSSLVKSCREEIALIDREIRNRSIPFPAKMPQRRYCNVQLAALPKIARTVASDNGEANVPPSGDPLGLPRQRGRLHRAGQIFAAAMAVRKSARAGAIVVVGAGRRAAVLATICRMMGRKVIPVESGYGSGSNWIVPGLLRRPAEKSFLAWLSADPIARLEGSGALVLLDDANEADELAALTGLERHLPPIIRPAALVAGGKVEAGQQRHVAIAPKTVDAGSPPVSTQTWPKISVVTVSYNQAAYLEAAMRSVLDQNYPNLEYIVVDGGSTDGSVEIIERYRSRLAHVIIEPDDGQSDALNKGFQLATGEVMNWLCSDDLFEPGAFARVGDVYRRFNPDLIVGGCVRIGETREAEIRRHHSALPFGRLASLSFEDMLQFMRSWQKSNYFFQPEVFFSRRAWESSGAFLKLHLYYAMDYDLWLRMAMAGSTAMHVPDMLGSSRVHGGQKTRDDHVYLHQLRQIMEEYLDLLLRVSDLLEPDNRRSGVSWHLP